jgi:hypothetical protein
MNVHNVRNFIHLAVDSQPCAVILLFIIVDERMAIVER